MNALFIYLLKASAGLTLVCISYYFFLRNDTNLVLKRFFLLSSTIICLIFPALDINLPGNTIGNIPVLIQSPGANLDLIPGNATLSGTAPSFGVKQVLFILYMSGVLLLLVKSLFSYRSWFRIKKEHPETINKLLYTDRNEGFSIFRTIHLPRSVIRSEEHASMLIHEQAHVRQLHFIDLLVCELAILLIWFNPFTWLISRMIKENHEHLADREVLLSGVDPAHYRAHLLNQTLGVTVFRFGQSFNHSLTKKRFEMMKNLNPGKIGLVKVLILMPLMLLSLGFINVSRAQSGSVTGNVKLSEGKPAEGASIILKNTTTGTITDKNGDFTLIIPGKSEIVISYVGFESEVVSVKPGQKVDINLKTRTVNIDLEKPEFRLSNGKPVNPVFIVDDKIVTSLDDINKDDIESIGVIKSPEEIKMKYPDLDTDRGVVIIRMKKKPEHPADKELFYIVEDMPQFPGGKKAMSDFIYSHLEYPEEAYKKGLEGDVLVQFTVNSEGKVVNPSVLESTDKIFEKAALNAISSMPTWKPGSQRGRKVAVLFSTRVVFKMPGE